jgi:cell division protein FtsB
MATDGGVILRRAIKTAMLGGVVWFAVQAGEFSSLDLLKQRRLRTRVTASIDSLQHRVDSLRKYENQLRTDAATQERIAREMFGMVRGDKEVLYRFADPRDTTKTP